MLAVLAFKSVHNIWLHYDMVRNGGNLSCDMTSYFSLYWSHYHIWWRSEGSSEVMIFLFMNQLMWTFWVTSFRRLHFPFDRVVSPVHGKPATMRPTIVVGQTMWSQHCYGLISHMVQVMKMKMILLVGLVFFSSPAYALSFMCVDTHFQFLAFG